MQRSHLELLLGVRRNDCSNYHRPQPGTRTVFPVSNEGICPHMQHFLSSYPLIVTASYRFDFEHPLKRDGCPCDIDVICMLKTFCYSLGRLRGLASCCNPIPDLSKQHWVPTAQPRGCRLNSLHSWDHVPWCLNWDTTYKWKFTLGRPILYLLKGAWWLTPNNHDSCVPGGWCHGTPWQTALSWLPDA